MAGLTPEGLVIKRLPEVLSDIETAERANIDPSINTNDDELLGQLNNIIAAAIAEQWALSEAVNDNFNPLKAEGKNLDDIAAILGISRIAASKSTTANQQFTGDEGTVIPANVILENPNTTDRFVTTVGLTLSVVDCIAANLNVQSILNNTVYTVVVNSTQYDFTSDGDATELEILNGIKALIDADGAATWTAAVDGSDIIITTSDANNIAVTGLVNMLANKVTNDTTAEALVTGPVIASNGIVVTIVSTVSGLDSTVNTTAYIVGRETESDEDFRARILVSQQATGAATVPAIEDAVANITGVSSVQLIENRTFVVDGDGRPPKSFETIVQGGTDAEVAQTIWDKKPAGIETFGTTTVPVLDSSGDPQSINFSRPVIVNMAFRVTYSKYAEETFPATGEAIMQQTIIDITNALGIDVDVIPTRYFGPIYAAVSGIDSLLVEIQVLASSGDAPVGGSWTTVTQAIDSDEFAGTEAVDITFVAL